MRLIDADANIKTMEKCAENPEDKYALLCYRYAKRVLEEAPTVEPASCGTGCRNGCRMINMLILEVMSTTGNRYFLNANQIAWMQAVERGGTLIAMSDGIEIRVDNDVKDVLRSLCVSERSGAHNFDEWETAVIPKVELTGEETSDKKQTI